MKKVSLAVITCAVLCSLVILSYLKHSGASTVKAPELFPDLDDDAPVIIPGNATVDPLVEKSFDAWLRSNLDKNCVPSVMTSIISGDNTVYSNGINADEDTRFCIASLTKTFTSILVLALRDEGKLSLDDPVTKYLPGVAIERSELESAQVTIRNLMAHTSGMPSVGGKYIVYRISGRELRLPEQVIPAGYSYAYSNESYILLKEIIEAAAGDSYSILMNRYIFKPLGMDASSADGSNGTGGIMTSMRDLTKFAVMLIHKGEYRGRKVFGKFAYNEMVSKNVELMPVDVDYYYSLGWEVISINGKVDSFYKAGRWYGGASCVHVFPKKRMALLYLCNPPNHLSSEFMSWRQSLTGRLRTLARSIAGDPALCTAWPKIMPFQLRNYAGEYKNSLTGTSIHITFRNNGLFSDYSGPQQPLQVFTSNRLLAGGETSIYNFVWNDRRVIGLALGNGYYARQH